MSDRILVTALALALSLPASALAAGAGPATPSGARAKEAIVKVTHSEKEWQKLLTSEQFRVLRQHGAEVGFDSSWSVPGFPLSAVVIELDGENGKLLVSNDALELDLREARAGWPAGHTRVGHAELPQPGRFDVNGDGYYLEDAAFLAWATGAPAPPTTVDAALRVQRVMDALYRSAADGGRVTRVAG